jgi:biopolymer transport protein ExbD
MRFARHAQIFRGPLDPAPVAAVVLLLMMLMLLGSFVYTPGVLIQLGQTITVTSSNEVAFAGKSYAPGEMDQLRTDLKHAPGATGFKVVLEPGADPALGRQVSNLFQVALPDGKYLTGTDNATVVVGVDFRGQCFFENRLVQDAELKAALSDHLKDAARIGKKLTLILWLDKAVEVQNLARIEGLAGEAGITEVLLAERPPAFGVKP